MFKKQKGYSRQLHKCRPVPNVTPLLTRDPARGFTIVELLVVVVIIAILAAITVISYNGLTLRAENTRRIAAARQVQTLFKSYIALYGKNPAEADGNTMSGGVCLTIDNICTNYAGQVVSSDNTQLISELRKIGTPPQSVSQEVSNSYTTYKGIYLDYIDWRTYNGKPAPYLMMYWLKGEKQQCALPDVTMHDPDLPDINGVQNPMITSTKGYSYSSDDYPNEDAGLTECYVSL